MRSNQSRALTALAVYAAASGAMMSDNAIGSFRQVKSDPPVVSADYVEQVKREMRAERARKRKKRGK